MKVYEVLLEIYNSHKADNETVLQCFLRCGKKLGMKNITRAEFEKRWEECAKYPAKMKLDIITTREKSFADEVTNAMLACDPEWDEVVEWCTLIKAASEAPRGLPMALEALAGHDSVKAEELKARAVTLFPELFNSAAAE